MRFEGDVLVLGEEQISARVRTPGRRFWLVLAAVLAAIAAMGLILAPMAPANLFEPAKGDHIRIDFRTAQRIESMTEDEAQLLTKGEDALARNEAIPVSALPIERAAGLHMAASDAQYGTALRCLAQAVYYEAAREPLPGRRAVAQVVINRMRHPAYPKSICGVVYQGSERRTGCQFSFTCDGSLLRAPVPRYWKEAEEVAKEALAGYRDEAVGTATHYHADYVLPKWAFQLAKLRQLGHHIFYRFNGSLGAATAFSGRYAGIERIPTLDFAALRMRLAEGAAVNEAPAPGLTVPPHVTDRHAENDVGGRIDVTKTWRLSIPDPVSASTRYRDALTGAESANQPASAHVASAGTSPEALPR